MNELERLARWLIFQHFAQSGEAPSLERLTRLLERPEADVREALAGLAKLRQVVLAEDGTTIRMAAPFAGFESGMVVEAGSERYHAPCMWDALGIPALLGRDAVIEVRASFRGPPLRLLIRDGALLPTMSVIQFIVPAARFWEDIGFT